MAMKRRKARADQGCELTLTRVHTIVYIYSVHTILYIEASATACTQPPYARSLKLAKTRLFEIFMS